MACGSNMIFDSAVANGCSVQFLTGETVIKEFDTITTSINRSSAGNLKLSSNDGNSVVILTEADITAMGFDDEADFMVFYNAVRSSCLGGGGWSETFTGTETDTFTPTLPITESDNILVVLNNLVLRKETSPLIEGSNTYDIIDGDVIIDTAMAADDHLTIYKL